MSRLVSTFLRLALVIAACSLHAACTDEGAAPTPSTAPSSAPEVSSCLTVDPPVRLSAPAYWDLFAYRVTDTCSTPAQSYLVVRGPERMAVAR